MQKQVAGDGAIGQIEKAADICAVHHDAFFSRIAAVASQQGQAQDLGADVAGLLRLGQVLPVFRILGDLIVWAKLAKFACLGGGFEFLLCRVWGRGDVVPGFEVHVAAQSLLLQCPQSAEVRADEQGLR